MCLNVFKINQGTLFYLLQHESALKTRHFQLKRLFLGVYNNIGQNLYEVLLRKCCNINNK